MLCDSPTLANALQNVITDAFVLYLVPFSNRDMVGPVDIPDEIKALGHRRDAPIGFELKPVFHEFVPYSLVDTV